MNNTNNGTPYTDEQWKRWYSNESSSDRAQQEEENKDKEATGDE